MRRQAVAVEYGSQKAPTVLAKAEGVWAETLVDHAQRQGLFIAENPRLAALLSRIDVDAEIPAELYESVAVVLSWVYWLQGLEPPSADGRPRR